MRLFKMRVIALAAFVVAVLGVTLANAHSQYHYSAFLNTTCSGKSLVGADSIPFLKSIGFVAVIDNQNPSQGCIVI